VNEWEKNGAGGCSLRIKPRTLKWAGREAFIILVVSGEGQGREGKERGGNNIGDHDRWGGGYHRKIGLVT